jgi:hypothetical protein
MHKQSTNKVSNSINNHAEKAEKEREKGTKPQKITEKAKSANAEERTIQEEEIIRSALTNVRTIQRCEENKLLDLVDVTQLAGWHLNSIETIKNYMTSENSIRDTQNNNEKEMFKTRGFENLIQKVNNVSKNIDAHINNIDMEDVSTNGESEMATIMRNQTSGQGASKLELSSWRAPVTQSQHLQVFFCPKMKTAIELK